MKNHTLTEQFLSRTLSRRNFKTIPKSGDSKDPCNDPISLLSVFSHFPVCLCKLFMHVGEIIAVVTFTALEERECYVLSSGR